MVRRPPEGAPPELAPLLSSLDSVVARLAVGDADRHAALLNAAADEVGAVALTLRGPLGAGALIADPIAAVAFEHRAAELAERLLAIEARLDSAAGDETADADDIEARNAALIELKDAVWALRWDRLATARAIDELAARGPIGRGALAAYHSIQVALSALDRLEVRGRDSAGLHVLVAGHDLDLSDPDVARLIADRASDSLFTSRSVRVAGGNLAFVYKTAAEIGELGDNTARLRAQIQADDLLSIALRSDSARTAVLSHTRWASIGIISEPNAHPLNQEELGATKAEDSPYVIAALNGDVDNYADLKALESLHLPPEITTDAKVIPALTSRRIASGVESTEAFRSTVASFEGSVAICAEAGADPDRIMLALRGSGQALYVGLGDDTFVVASEPYGVVEECDRYLRLDGETMLDVANPASQGQVVVVDARQAGSIAGIARQSYDGRVLPVSESELQTPEITTRDVARGEAAHYLLKEMAEAPASFRKTLRGRIVDRDGRLDVRLPAETLSPEVLGRLHSGSIRRVLAIGQGSAHVAGQSLARVLREALGALPVTVEAFTATELSGFELTADMSDTLVVAISQSGTTTDTNRTVDLARARGAVVVAIVNRRQSDLVDKSDGVLYTSDGRDVEMSVASTKAFYAQLAAGHLLALRLATELGADTPADRDVPQRAVAGAPRAAGRDARGVRAPAGDRGGRATALALAPVVGGRGQRREPHRRARAAHQALGALLQVDRVRRHRGQEAHRPLVGADDPRVRGRSARIERRRRRQGGRDLPRAQGRADRDRRRRRDALRDRGVGDDLGAGRAPVARVRAVRARRPPLRLRGRARDRRVGAAAARSARLHRGVGGCERSRPARRARG